MNSKLSSLGSLLAIAIILVLGVGYLTFGVAKVEWARSPLTVTMNLPDSGGLLPRSKVLLSGIEVGRVASVRHTRTGVAVELRLDTRYRVPATGTARIESMSALGEPYVEFVPATPNGPYLRNGAIVDADKVSLPVSMPALAQSVTTVLQQVDPDAIGSIIGTFNTAFAGTEAVMPQLTRSTSLLAATLLSRTDVIRRMLIALQGRADDMAWAGPDLAAAADPWRQFGPRVGQMVDVMTQNARADDGPAGFLVNTPESIGLVPFFTALGEWFKKYGADVAQLTPALQPLIASATDVTSKLDISALIEQALNATSPDGALRLQINTK
ncbi:MAG: mce8F [Nocardia sp.]|uniref:MlaD family protein n=1 Tax=Nocardia sp. TaxID=1821 RepID=UPI00262C83A2|nr:MlaD family protein [Nocardia sp.]MCU1639968.1 mce8F [Nocardia sp.]